MAAHWAILIVTWATIVVLYLGLAAVLREVRLLRDRVGADAAAGGQISIRLPAAVTRGHRRVVAAVDSGCPLCRVVARRLAAITAVRPVLLTFEPVDQWSGVDDRLDVVRDDRAWSAIAHLSTPVLMLVDGDGAVERLVLPASERDILPTLASWGVLTAADVPSAAAADAATDSATDFAPDFATYGKERSDVA
jgi:hypothetical protein